jgi:hypothetical protein
LFRKSLTVLILGTVLCLAAPAAHANASSEEAEFVSRINALRASKHLAPLRVDDELTSIARRWAQQMVINGDISHQPDLRQWVTSVWRKLGENVGVGYSVAGLHDAFLTSPHHYDNLVDPAFDAVGIGVVNAKGRMWVAEEFKQSAGGTPAPTTVAPRRTTTSTSPPTTRRPAPPTTTTTIAPRPPPTPRPPPPPPPPESPRLRQVLELQRALDATLGTGR